MGAAAPFLMFTKSYFQNVYPCTIYYLCFNRTCYSDIVKYFKILKLMEPAPKSMSRWNPHLSFRVKRHNKGEENEENRNKCNIRGNKFQPG